MPARPSVAFVHAPQLLAAGAAPAIQTPTPCWRQGKIQERGIPHQDLLTFDWPLQTSSAGCAPLEHSPKQPSASEVVVETAFSSTSKTRLGGRLRDRRQDPADDPHRLRRLHHPRHRAPHQPRRRVRPDPRARRRPAARGGAARRAPSCRTRARTTRASSPRPTSTTRSERRVSFGEK